MKIGKTIFLLTIFMIMSERTYAQSGYFRVEKMSAACDEIGMSGQMPSGCLLQTTVYKGQTCYRCRPEEKCNPECQGGKMCVDKRCVCPPNRGLVDCNGVCVNGLQCKGLVAPRDVDSTLRAKRR